MMPRVTWLAALLLLGWGSSAPALAIDTPPDVAVLRAQGKPKKKKKAPPEKPLEELTFDAPTLKVEGPRIIAELPGTLKTTEGELPSLLVDLKAMPVEAGTGKFTITLECKDVNIPLKLSVVSAKGEVKTEIVRVALNPSGTWLLARTPPNEAPTFERHWSVGLGVALLSYEQPGLQPFTQQSISGKGVYRRSFLEGQWLGEANLYGTLVPFSSSLDGVNLRTFGLNFRAGRVLLTLPGNWRIAASTGIFYTTTLSSGADFGFRNLLGGQLYPSAVKQFDGKNAIALYLKLVPLYSLSLSEREIALGVQWSHELKSGTILHIHLDYADLAFNATDTSSQQVISRNTVLGASVGF